MQKIEPKQDDAPRSSQGKDRAPEAKHSLKVLTSVKVGTNQSSGTGSGSKGGG